MKRSSAKIRLTLNILLCCSLLWAGVGCEKNKGNGAEKSEFEIDKKYERGPLVVHVRADKSKMTIAETVQLQLEAAIESGYEVQIPKVGEVLKDFGIVDWDSPGDKLDQDNRIVSKYQYRLEPFLSGTFAIPAFTFEFHDVNNPEEKKYELTTEPFNIEVTSLLGEQRAELQIEDIEDVLEVPKKASYWWVWPFIVIVLVGACTGLWLYLRRKRIKELVRLFKPAHELAYERLRALVKEDLVTAGQIKEFYERISNILRHYIEHRFSLKAPERTTEEFLAELANTDVLAASDKERLGEFLEHCDLVKFAKHTPTTEQIQKTFDLVKDFIEKTKSDDRKVDVTEMVRSEETAEIGSA